jgi:hypothetical protein
MKPKSDTFRILENMSKNPIISLKLDEAEEPRKCCSWLRKPSLSSPAKLPSEFEAFSYS